MKRWLPVPVILVLFALLSPTLAQENPFPLPNLEVITPENVSRLSQLALLPGGAGAVFGEDSAVLISGDNGSSEPDATPRLRMRDLTTGEEWFTSLPDSTTHALAASPSAQVFASGGSGPGDGNSVRLWDMWSGSQNGTLAYHNRAIEGLAYSTEGDWLASAGGDVRLWHMDDYEETAIDADGFARAVALSPYFYSEEMTFSEVLAYSVWDGKPGGHVYLWNIREGRVYGELPHEAEVSGLAFDPDGFNVVTAAEDGLIRIWRYEPPPLLIGTVAHGGQATSVAFNPYGSLLVSGGTNGEIRFWQYDPVVGSASFLTAVTQPPVTSLAFSPGGRLLASTGVDGKTRLWGVVQIPEPEPPIKTLVLSSGRLALDYPRAWLADELDSVSARVASSQEASDAMQNGGELTGGFAVFITLLTPDSFLPEPADDETAPVDTAALSPVDLMTLWLTETADSSQGETVSAINSLVISGRRAARTATFGCCDRRYDYLLIETGGPEVILVIAVAAQAEFDSYEAALLGILDSLEYSPTGELSW